MCVSRLSFNFHHFNAEQPRPKRRPVLRRGAVRPITYCPLTSLLILLISYWIGTVDDTPGLDPGGCGAVVEGSRELCTKKRRRNLTTHRGHLRTRKCENLHIRAGCRRRKPRRRSASRILPPPPDSETLQLLSKYLTLNVFLLRWNN